MKVLLLGAGGNYSQTYGYSAIGNITSKSDVGSYLYQGNTGSSYANPHAATSINGQTYAYDNNDNLTTAATTTYAWDYQNRLIQAGAGQTATSTFYVYDDATPWLDWSWYSTRNFSNTSPVYRGTHSLKMTYNKPWAGSSYDTVKFAINGGSTRGQSPYVILYRPDQSLLGTVYLPDIIGTIAPNTWYQVSIPLTSLGASTSTIGDFSIESPTATTIYLDDIRFEGHAQGSAATRYTYDHAGQRTSYFDIGLKTQIL